MTPSLCETCRHMREVRTARSRFLLCELAMTNDHYPKYPPQPVVNCAGHEVRDVQTRCVTAADDETTRRPPI
jgi:hypothetical protein